MGGDFIVHPNSGHQSQLSGPTICFHFEFDFKVLNTDSQIKLTDHHYQPKQNTKSCRATKIVIVNFSKAEWDASASYTERIFAILPSVNIFQGE